MQRTYALEVGRTERKTIPLLHRVLTCKKKRKKFGLNEMLRMGLMTFTAGRRTVSGLH